MNKRGQRVLVPGGAGLIGSHLAEDLLRRGALGLVIMDNVDFVFSSELKQTNLEAIGRVGRYEFHAVDICEMAHLSRVMALTRPDVVTHLAARAGVRPIEQPQLYEHVNVAGTLNLLEHCRQFRVHQFIFGSSSSVQGSTSCVSFYENQFELRPNQGTPQ